MGVWLGRMGGLCLCEKGGRRGAWSGLEMLEYMMMTMMMILDSNSFVKSLPQHTCWLCQPLLLFSMEYGLTYKLANTNLEMKKSNSGQRMPINDE